MMVNDGEVENCVWVMSELSRDWSAKTDQWPGGVDFPKFVGVRTMVADKGQEIVQSHTCGGLANWQILGENPA